MKKFAVFEITNYNSYNSKINRDFSKKNKRIIIIFITNENNLIKINYNYINLSE